MYIEVQKTYAMVIGTVLALVGIVGFVSTPIFGIFGVNMYQNILHILGGGVGLALALMHKSTKTYIMVLGIVAAVVAVLGFLPVVSGYLETYLGVNQAISILHAVIALVSLGVAFGVKQ